MSEGKLICARKYTGIREQRRPNRGGKLGLTVILSLSPRTSNIPGITVPLFSLMSVTLFSKTESPGPRKDPDTVSCPCCPAGLGSSSLTLALSSMAKRHLGHHQLLGQAVSSPLFYKHFLLALGVPAFPAGAVTHPISSETLCSKPSVGPSNREKPPQQWQIPSSLPPSSLSLSPELLIR